MGSTTIHPRRGKLGRKVKRKPAVIQRCSRRTGDLRLRHRQQQPALVQKWQRDSTAVVDRGFGWGGWHECQGMTAHAGLILQTNLNHSIRAQDLFAHTMIKWMSCWRFFQNLRMQEHLDWTGDDLRCVAIVRGDAASILRSEHWHGRMCCGGLGWNGDSCAITVRIPLKLESYRTKRISSCGNFK